MAGEGLFSEERWPGQRAGRPVPSATVTKSRQAKDGQTTMTVVPQAPTNAKLNTLFKGRAEGIRNSLDKSAPSWRETKRVCGEVEAYYE